MMIEPGGIGILRYCIFAAIYMRITDIFLVINITASTSRLSCLVWPFLSTRNQNLSALDGELRLHGLVALLLFGYEASNFQETGTLYII